MLEENAAESALPIVTKEDAIGEGFKILETSAISTVNRELSQSMRSPSKRELKSDVMYETRGNKKIKIEDEIQGESNFQITPGDEYPAESTSLLDSNLISIKTERNIEEMESFYVITEYEQKIEMGNTCFDCNDVTPLNNDSKMDYDLTDASVKIRNDIGAFISEKFQRNAKSSDCNDSAISTSESSMKSEPSVDSSQNSNSMNFEASFKYNANSQFVKMEPELQIEPSSENLQQKSEFEEQDLPSNIKESDDCNTNRETNSNSSSETVKEFEPLDYVSYVCPECGEGLETAQARLWHLAEQHEEITNPNPFPNFKCKICGDVRVLMNSLTNHIRLVHYDGKPYSCTPCAVDFSNKESYCKHMSSHPSVFQCDYCKKSFISKRTRNIHLKSHSLHTENFNYSCSVCGTKFQRRLGLKEHMAMHSLDTPYQCEYCDEKFKSAGRLSRHCGKVHRDTFTHQCTKCSRKFASNSRLTAHMGRTHNSYY